MRRKILRPALLFAVLLSAVSCNLPEGPEHEEGTLTLFLPATTDPALNTAGGAVSRSVLRDDFISGLSYRLTFTRTAGGAFSLEAGEGGAITISLEAGPWHIDAAAYDGTELVGEGDKDVSIIAGEEIIETISMTVDPDYEAGLTAIYIHNEAELRRIGAAVNGLAMDDPARTFYLENDIVLSAPWTPIGPDEATPFAANFDGQGHSISITGFTDPSAEYLGFFGCTDGAEIKDLRIVCNLGSETTPLPLGVVSSYSHVGALAGKAVNGSVFENITVSGSLYFSRAAGAYETYFGGIAGYSDGGIEGCRVSANLNLVTQDGSVYAGGAAGYTTSSIVESSFAGTLKAGGVSVVYAGGLAGSASAVTSSYVYGSVETLSSYFAGAGGIAGRADGNIQNCYTLAGIKAEGTGSSADSSAGGIAGALKSGGSVTKCYALSTVTAITGGGAVHAGGIAGENTGGTIGYCAALQREIDGGGSTAVRGIAGYNSPSTSPTYTTNLAAGNIIITRATGVLPDADLDGDTSYLRDDFKRDSPFRDDLYTPLDWNFTSGTGGWKWLSAGSSYEYPVLSWQETTPDYTEPPAGGFGFTPVW